LVGVITMNIFKAMENVINGVNVSMSKAERVRTEPKFYEPESHTHHKRTVSKTVEPVPLEEPRL